MIADRLDNDTISALLRIVETKAPMFMRTAGITHEEREFTKVLPETTAAIIARFEEQRQAGAHDLYAIAREFGLSYACIVRQTYAHRMAIQRRASKASK